MFRFSEKGLDEAKQWLKEYPLFVSNYDNTGDYIIFFGSAFDSSFVFRKIEECLVKGTPTVESMQDKICSWCDTPECVGFSKQCVDSFMKPLQEQRDLSNCVPSCIMCNSKKWTWDYTEWFTDSNPVFDKNRLIKIKRWLEEDYKNIPSTN